MNQMNSRNTGTCNTKDELPWYIMAVELGEGESASLKIYLDSKPEEWAFNFCKANNWDYTSMGYLSVEIDKWIKSFLKNGQEPDNKGDGMKECIIEVDEENLTYNTEIKQGINDKRNVEVTGNCDIKTRTGLRMNKGNNNKRQNKAPRVNPKCYSQSKNKMRIWSCSNSIQTSDIAGKRKRNPKFIPYKKEIIEHDKMWINNAMYQKYQKQKDENKKHWITETNESSKISKEINDVPVALSTPGDNANSDKKATKKNKFKNKEQPLITDKDGNKKKNNISISRFDKINYINYGQLLYEKGLQHEEIKQNRIHCLKDKLLELNQFSFQPKWNENNKSAPKVTVSNIVNYREVVEERIRKIKDKYNLEKENYTFIPNLNEKSKWIDKKHHPNLRKNERINILYESAQQVKLKWNCIKNEWYSECTFTPKLTVESKSQKHSIVTEENGDWLNKSFNDRLRYYSSKKEIRWNKLIEDTHAPGDPITGQKFFQPVLCTGPSDNTINSNISKRSHSNVFINLYSYADKYKHNKSQIEKSIEEYERDQRQIPLNRNSQKVYNRRKQEVFDKIFAVLARDNDEHISFLNIGLTNLAENVRKIINPLLEEIKLSQEKIDKKDFMDMINILFEMISPEERRVLLIFGYESKSNSKSKSKSKRTWNNEFTFNPAINNQSKIIDQRSSMNILSKSMIHRGNHTSMEKENSYSNFLKRHSQSNSFCY